jgi:hypothetical protein
VAKSGQQAIAAYHDLMHTWFTWGCSQTSSRIPAGHRQNKLDLEHPPCLHSVAQRGLKTERECSGMHTVRMRAYVPDPGHQGCRQEA